MDRKEKLSAFNLVVESRIMSDTYLEEPDGILCHWENLSPEGRLSYLVKDAAMYDISFDQFIEVARETVDASAIENAALRLAFSGSRELHHIEKLFPDGGRTESAPLVDRVSDLLDQVAFENPDFNRLIAEQRDDASQRPLHEKGLLYEDMTLSDLLFGNQRIGEQVVDGFFHIEQQLDSGLQMLLESHDVPKAARLAVRDYMSTVLTDIRSLEKRTLNDTERTPERNEMSR